MRITVTLDPDVAEKLKAYSHRGELSIAQAINELIRRGLTAQIEPQTRARFLIEPHAGGFRPGVDPAKLNETLDVLDTQDFIREAD